MLIPVFISLFAFVLAVALLAQGRKIAHHLGFVDKSGGRKDHDGEIPPIGGLVIIPVFVVAMALERAFGGVWMISWPVLAGVSAILAMGALDDKFNLPAGLRFCAQFAIAIFVILMTNATLFDLGPIFTTETTYTYYLALPFTVMCLAVLMNGLNMIDGLDGLSGGWCALTLLIFASAAALSGQDAFVWTALFMLAPLCAFLIFNARHPWRHKASVFIGDSGAMALAFFIGWMGVRLSQPLAGADPVLPAILIVWIFALPVMDLFALFFVRLAQKRHPFSPDRYHLHHRLLARGWTPERTVQIILMMSLFMSVFAIAAYKLGVPDYVLMYIWIAVLLGHTARSYLKYGRKS